MTQNAAQADARPIDTILKTLRGLVIATIILYVALASVAGYSYITSNDNRIAVCRLRDDLSRRVDSSKEFLIHHPKGLPRLGVTRTDILKEIHNQERTLNALSVVSC